MKNANDNFGSSNGSENFYCNRPSLMLYTDGVKDLAETCQAYWLIDLIISHQCKRDVNLERFQSWELRRVEGNTFFIYATDGSRVLLKTNIDAVHADIAGNSSKTHSHLC